MSYRETESDRIAKESFLSHPVNSDDFAHNLLRETNQSFEFWLGASSQPSCTEQSAHSSGIAPRQPREIDFDGTLTVDGYVAGVVRSPAGTLVLTARGEIDGDIAVDVAVIHGSVRGDIYAASRVELGGDARVVGEIETLELLIHPGAVFEGRCNFPAGTNGDADEFAQAGANDLASAVAS